MILQHREEGLLPFLKRILKVDIIVDAVDQPRGAMFPEHAVEIPAALAKVVVARVSERKDREAQVGKRRRLEIPDMVEKVEPVIWRLSFTPCANGENHRCFLKQLA